MNVRITYVKKYEGFTHVVILLGAGVVVGVAVGVAVGVVVGGRTYSQSRQHIVYLFIIK